MKIWQRIALAFFITSVIISISANGILYWKAKGSLQKEIDSRLLALAQSRVEHIQSFLKQNQQILKLLSNSYIFEAVLKSQAKKNEKFRELADETRKVLSDIMKAKPDFRAVFIISRDGNITLSSDKLIVSVDRSSAPSFLGSKQEPYIRDAFYSDVAKEGMIAISHPVTETVTNKFLGVIVATISLKELNKITTNPAGLGQTGEIYLINKDDYMITKSRFKKETFLKEKIIFPNQYILKSKKLSGLQQKGTAFSYVNYRGVRAFALYLPIPSFNWGLVAEIEESEVFYPLRLISMYYVFIIAVVPFIAILIGMALSRPITSSIRKLQHGLSIVGKGDLDFKVGIDANDEIGEFSKAFDQMTDNLKNTIVKRDLLTREIVERKKIESTLRRSEETIKRFSRMIIFVQEEEKKRISRDLHDETGQIAISLGASLNLLEKEIRDNNTDQAFEMIENAKEILTDITAKMKTIALDLRPPELDISGLPVVLKEYFSQCRQRHGLAVHFTENLEGHTINDDILITLYRVTQEAMNNVVQHASASGVRVDINASDEDITLKIADDGKGFDVSSVMDKSNQRHLGINGIKERVELLNGKFQIHSTLGQGTEILVHFLRKAGN